MKLKSKSDTDLYLISAIKKGDKKAFTILYEKYWEKLYFVSYQHTQSVQESEDLIHEVFIDLWKNRRKIQINKAVSTYIFTAIKYKIFRWYDGKTVRKKYAQRFINEIPNPYDTPEKELSFKELYCLIEQEIENLPDRCKLIFKMRRLEEFPIDEIAKKLDISKNTVNNQITKASKILKLNLKEYLNSTLFL